MTTLWSLKVRTVFPKHLSTREMECDIRFQDRFLKTQDIDLRERVVSEPMSVRSNASTVPVRYNSHRTKWKREKTQVKLRTTAEIGNRKQSKNKERQRKTLTKLLSKWVVALPRLKFIVKSRNEGGLEGRNKDLKDGELYPCFGTGLHCQPGKPSGPNQDNARCRLLYRQRRRF